MRDCPYDLILLPIGPELAKLREPGPISPHYDGETAKAGTVKPRL